MKFFCEYCGARIDAELDDKCPNCGASYKNNEAFLEMEKQEQEQCTEFKKQIIGGIAFSKILFIFPILVFLVFIVCLTLFFKKKVYLNQKELTVNLNEYVTAAKYKVKVVKYEYIDIKYGFNKLETNQEYVKFYLLVENISKEQITREKVNCIVDGVAQTNYNSAGYSDLPFFIEKGLTVQGTATFIVPKDAKAYDIKYGDYTTIHIEK